MSSSQSPIPWSEVGTLDARALVSTCDQISRICEEAFPRPHAPGIPRNFSDAKWRYELYIFWMFWVWYVANSPRQTTAGATKPLLDAFYPGCCEELVRVGLIERNLEAIRQWKDDLEERFRAYKKAWDTHLTEKDQGPRLIDKGGVGWLFARYLFRDSAPHPAFVIFFDTYGSKMFTSRVQMITELEAAYSHTKPRWKFWK